MTLFVIPDAETPSTGMPGAVEHGDQSMSFPEVTSASTDVASLSTLDPAAQEIAVTGMLDQAWQWLERVKIATTPPPAQEVADFKAFVSTIAEAAKQKKLSEDIQEDATVMVRRSERALGVAIRAGQAAGDIASRGGSQGIHAPGVRGTLSRTSTSDVRDPGVGSVKSLIPNGQELHETYTLTDDVSEEEFDFALAIAKEEGNLSRANVVRKVKEVKTSPLDQAEKWEQVAEFASRGFTSSQIAKTIEMSEPWLRKQAADRGIAFPADKIAGSRRIDSLKVLEKVVASYEASADAIDLVTYEDVTPEMAAELLERLNFGIKAIRRLMKALDAVNQEIK